MWRNGLMLVCSSVLMGVPAWAAHPLETDDADTLGAGQAELELTWDASRQRQSGLTVRERVWGLHLGYGITDRLDLFVELSHQDLRNQEADAYTTQTGPGDVNLGFKYGLGSGGSTRYGLTGSLSLGNADERKGLGPGRPGLSLAGIASGALGEHLNWHGNLGLNWNRYALAEDREALRSIQPFAQAALAYEAGTPLVWLAEIIAEGPAERQTHHWDSTMGVGGIWHVQEGMDASLAYRHGLSRNATDHLLTAGVTLRF